MNGYGYLLHSAKGSTWKNHKYIKKEGKRYIYSHKDGGKEYEEKDEVEETYGHRDRASENSEARGNKQRNAARKSQTVKRTLSGDIKKINDRNDYVLGLYGAQTRKIHADMARNKNIRNNQKENLKKTLSNEKTRLAKVTKEKADNANRIMTAEKDRLSKVAKQKKEEAKKKIKNSKVVKKTKSAAYYMTH